MSTNLAPWNLYRQGSNLFWEGHSLTDLAQRYGTPLYVVSRRGLEASYRTLVEAFRAEHIALEVFFSFKTNPVPDVLRVLIERGAGAEVIAPYELRLALELGVPGSRIVVNGPVKPPELLEDAVACDVGLINVESVGELQRLLETAARLGKRPNVGLRINPAVKGRRFDLTLSTGRAASPMGLLPGSTDWHAALELLEASPALHLRGLHCHIGSGIRSAAPYRTALATVLHCWADVWRRGFRPTVLDLGGGFNVPSLKALNLREAARLFGWGKPPRPPNPTESATLLPDVARVCAEQFDIFQQQTNLPIPTLYVEPGRALSATAQILLLRVEALVEREHGPTSALCDGGAMSLSPLLLTEYHTIVVANKDHRHPTRVYNLQGNMPTPLDIVAVQRTLPVLAPGDVLAVLDVGAYFTTLGNTFAGPRPAIAMLDDDMAHLIRRRETFDDLFARDQFFHSASFPQN